MAWSRTWQIIFLFYSLAKVTIYSCIFKLTVANCDFRSWNLIEGTLLSEYLQYYMSYSSNCQLAISRKSKFPLPVCPFQKVHPSGTLLFQKSKAVPSKLLPARKKSWDRRESGDFRYEFCFWVLNWINLKC